MYIIAQSIQGTEVYNTLRVQWSGVYNVLGVQ